MAVMLLFRKEWYPLEDGRGVSALGSKGRGTPSLELLEAAETLSNLRKAGMLFALLSSSELRFIISARSANIKGRASFCRYQ